MERIAVLVRDDMSIRILASCGDWVESWGSNYCWLSNLSGLLSIGANALHPGVWVWLGDVEPIPLNCADPVYAVSGEWRLATDKEKSILRNGYCCFRCPEDV